MNKISLVIYNMLLLLTPVTLNFCGLTYAKVMLGYSVLILLYLILTKQVNKSIFKNKTFQYISMGYLAFLIVVSLSVVVSSIVNKKNVVSNFFEILRVVVYYLVLINYFLLLNKKTAKVFHISFTIMVMLNIVLSFFQFHNLFGLNELYVEKIASTQFVTLVNDYPWPRTVGLAGNPNVFGFLMTLFSIYFLTLIFKEPKKWYYYVFYFLTVIGLFQSGARTAYVALVMSNALLVILNFLRFNKQTIKKTVVIGFILLMAHIILLLILPDLYTWRIKTLLSFNNENSYQQRMEKNERNLEERLTKEEFSKSQYAVLIGEGPSKSSRGNAFDNEWLMLFFQYGIIGVIVFLWMILFPLKTIKENTSFFYPLYSSVVLANFVYMLLVASFHSYLLFEVTLILMAISLKMADISTCLQEGT